MATTDFSLRAIASTSTFSIARAASVPGDGARARSEPHQLAHKINIVMNGIRYMFDGQHNVSNGRIVNYESLSRDRSPP